MMLQTYDDINSRKISKFMMNENNIKLLCNNLIGYQLHGGIYTIEKLLKDELRYTISRNLDDNIEITSIKLLRNGQSLDICKFSNDKVFLNNQIIKIENLYKIVLSEIRENKLNELGI